MTETIRIQYQDDNGPMDSVRMTWAPEQASAPIRLDGGSTQYQTADSAHKIDRAVRLMCKLAWPDVAAESWEEGGEAWDAVSYEPVRDDILAALADYDDGTGDLAVIVDHALANDPMATAADIAREVRDVREYAAEERRREAAE